ncbi:phosphatidylcholine and lysophosphatidylcholine phospholipase [Blastocladiella emersonii ATCC 22665]|nr:phosphatidylcholine and lysophosphatidylcholine phospholipase [Blastocladiella emersonii ATCC 22665]
MTAAPPADAAVDLTASVASVVSAVVGDLVSFAVVTLPATVLGWISRALSWSLVLTFDYRGVVFLLAATAALVYTVVYRVYLTRYSRLPQPPAQAKPLGASYDLHPDATGGGADDDTKPVAGFNYAEEFLGSFLQSIKIFGYMEQPVFHELARRLQTRKLPAGDVLFSSDSPGETNFYIVVEGCVQVFVKNPGSEHANPIDTVPTTPGLASSTPLSSSFYAPPPDPDEPLPGHTLLNEVHAGGTVSSLFSILSLFSSTLNANGADSDAVPPPPVPPVPTAASPWTGPLDQPFAAVRSRSATVENYPGASGDLALDPLAASSPDTPARPESTPGSSNGSSAGEGTVFPLLSKASPTPSPIQEPTGVFPSAAAPPFTHSRSGSASGRSAANGFNGNWLGGSSNGATAAGQPGRHSRHSSAGPHTYSTAGAGPAPRHHHASRGPSRGASFIHDPRVGPPHTSPSGVWYDGHLLPALDTGMTARASRDSTLLVIPAEAFLRLLDKYPHAAAHIAQVILTRFQRVTCAALSHYLGLPAALLAIDQQLHEYAARPSAVSSFFRPGGLERLRRRFHMSHSVFRSARATTTGASAGAGAGAAASAVESDAADVASASTSSRRASLTELHLATANLRGTPTGSANSDGGSDSTGIASAPTSANAGSPPGSAKASTTHLAGNRSAMDPRAAALAAATTPQARAMRAMSGIPGGRPNLAASGIASGAGGKAPTVLGVDTRAFDDLDEEGFLRRSVFASILDTIGLRDAAAAVMADKNPEDLWSVPSDVGGGGATHPAHHGGLAGLRRASGPSHGLHRGGPGSGGPSHYDSHRSLSSSVSATSAVSEVDTSDVEIRFYRKGMSLVKPGQPMDGLFFVIDGLLAVATGSPSDLSARGASDGTPGPMLAAAQQQTAAAAAQQQQQQQPKDARRTGAAAPSPAHQYFIRPGGLAGYMPALTGHASFLSLEARTDVCVGFMGKHALDRLVDRQPAVILTLAQRLVSVLSPLVLHIDFALEWMQVNAGHVLYRQGDASDSIYMVLNGRLRAIEEKKNGAFDVVSEHGQGESVGELEVLMGSSRPHTTHAIRDTELAQMPHSLFEALALRHPEITLAMARIIASRSQQHSKARATGDLGKNNANLRTVAILPVHAAVPVVEFADKLYAALTHTIGESALLLTQASVLSVLGKHAFTRMGKLKLMSWLAEQETRHRIVLYVADGGVTSPWTQRCIRQADCVLLVGVANQSPTVGEYERYLLGVKSTARKELVLLHPSRSCPHGTTQAWLNNRLWIHGHHHVAMDVDPSSAALFESGGGGAKPGSGAANGGTSTSSSAHPAAQSAARRGRKGTYVGPMAEDLGLSGALDHLKGTLRHYYSQYYTPLMLKLHGGGRRARPGMESLGPRSDFARLARRLCGRSIGLVLGGGGARGISQVGVIRALEEAGIPIDMVGGTSIGAMVGGLYARDVDHVSVFGRLKAFSGRMASVWRTLVDLTYPVTSYLTGHQFNRGVWKAFGDIHVEDLWLNYFCITTNIVHSRMEVHQTGYLWRYVRASMSLSGFLPPLSDNGILLVDGGYLNNLPGDVMKGLGADLVIMVDVASDDDTSKVFIDDSLSGFEVLLNRWNPFRKGKSIPSLADIQSKLAYVSCIRQLEEAKQLPGCFYLRPPVAHFGGFEFGNFQAIYDAGYEYGKQIVRDWEKSGVLKLFVGEKTRHGLSAAPMARRNSI